MLRSGTFKIHNLLKIISKACNILNMTLKDLLLLLGGGIKNTGRYEEVIKTCKKT